MAVKKVGWWVLQLVDLKAKMSVEKLAQLLENMMVDYWAESSAELMESWMDTLRVVMLVAMLDRQWEKLKAERKVGM